ncbi:MAG: hypothetical protein HRT35_23440 [Algicola sp.]|nr:hypothetical protein [Algicola sp.]
MLQSFKLVLTYSVVLSVLFVLVSCGGGTSSPSVTTVPTPSPTPDPVPVDVTFSVADLTTASSAEHYPLPMLSKSEQYSPASVVFSGSLSFSGKELIASIADRDWAGGGQKQFPSFTVQLVSDQQKILPLQRDIISTWQHSNSFWDVVIGTGQVWQNEDEAGWQHAFLPLHLVSRRVGQVKNCVLTFLYNQDSVSKAHVQCDQETSPLGDYQPGNMRGLIDVQYQPEDFSNKAELFNQHDQRLANRLSVRPWSDIDPNGGLFNLFNTDVADPSLQSMGAAIVDNTIYLQTPITRAGAYPFPDEMRHGVFSVTKTMAGALSLLYLAQRYDQSIFDELISDHVPTLSQHPGWQGVTFEHTVNMATGTVGEDNGNLIVPFILAASAQAGIDEIANLPDASPLPGATFAYASTHTFVLSTAMQNYVTAKEGNGVYYWDLVRQNVLQVIHADGFLLQTTEETNGKKGIPTLGWGAFPTIDDTAKIALLLHNDGQYQQQQLLHYGRTREALGKTGKQGYATGGRSRYRHSFWYREYESITCSFDVHYMSGHGGNTVSFMPSGVITVRYMDQNNYNLSPMAAAAENIRSSCVIRR